MTAEPARSHPLQAHDFSDLGRDVRIAVEPYVAMAVVRTADPAAHGLPAAPGTWVPRGAGCAVWLGPDEWLVTGPGEAPWDHEARLRAAVGGATVTDVSAQRITVRLGGSRARDVLAKGCALDLHPRVFTPGSSAQTVLGRAGVVLLAVADGYEVLVRSSFAGYLGDWLIDAALEFR